MLGSTQPQSVRLEHPEMTGQRVLPQSLDKLVGQAQHRVLVLTLWTQYDDPLILGGRVRADIGEASIQSDEGAPLAYTEGRKHGIYDSAGILIGYCIPLVD